MKDPGYLITLIYAAHLLAPASVELEFNKDPNKRLRPNNKTVTDWYLEFISAKEKEIGEGINSYRSTFEYFKSFIAGNSNKRSCEFTAKGHKKLF